MQGNLLEGDDSGIIKVMPPSLNFTGLSQSEINYFLHTLSSFDEKAQSQLLHLIQEEIIFVRINRDLHLEIKTNLA